MSDQLPRIVHRYWTGDQPNGLLDISSRWEDLNGNEWKLIDWSDEMLPPGASSFLAAHEWRVPPYDQPRHRSNILRYLLLLQFGGLWLDGDVEPLAPIEPLIHLKRGFLASIGGRPEGAVMAAAPGNRFFYDVLMRLSNEQICGGCGLVSGAGLLLRSLRGSQHRIHRLPTSVVFAEDATGWPIFGPKLFRHGWKTSRIAAVSAR